MAAADTHCMKTMMLWTLMLGMVQKVLQEKKKSRAGGGYSLVPSLPSLCGAVNPKVERGDSLDEGGAAADLGADRVVDLRDNLGVEWQSSGVCKMISDSQSIRNHINTK